jgi:CHAD domain-containing protein
VVAGYLSGRIAELRSGELATRRSGGHGVHDMRVAARRLRSTLRTFRSVVGQGRSRAVGSELKWLSDVLGDARDAEVLARDLAAGVAATPVDLVLGPVLATVDRHLARAAADADAALRSALDSARYEALLASLDALVDAPATTGRAARPAARALPKLVGKAYRRADRAAARVPTAPDRDAALHEVRKAVKRLRYAAEVAAPVIGAPAERTRKRARRVQRVLGDHHDTVVLRSTLREVGIQAHLAGANAFTFGLLHGRTGAAAARLERHYDRSWRRLAAGHALRWLP